MANRTGLADHLLYPVADRILHFTLAAAARGQAVAIAAMSIERRPRVMAAVARPHHDAGRLGILLRGRTDDLIRVGLYPVHAQRDVHTSQGLSRSESALKHFAGFQGKVFF